MGNAGSLSSHCCLQTIASSSRQPVTLIFHDGMSRTLAGNRQRRRLAGEVMFESPDCMVCHAHSFFIGQPLPILDINDELVAGETYFVLPLDCFPANVLSASSLAALGCSPRRASAAAPVNFRSAAFEYTKGSNGRVLIKVVPEFIVSLLSGGGGGRGGGENSPAGDDCNVLCSTPELKKHYEQLVGPKDQVWSPKLETITEYKVRYSPCKFIGLEWKQKEGEGN